MSRSNYDKPFYVDVGTSIAAIRCASNRDVVDSLDHHGSKYAIKIVEKTCDRMNQEAKQFYAQKGSSASMREALIKCREIAIQWEADEIAGVAGTTDKPEARSASEAIQEIEMEINAALAEPPRNCDVGSAGEQYRRWTYFCKFRNESRKTCSGCPVYAEQNKGQNSTCELVWAQMPYEATKEGGTK